MVKHQRMDGLDELTLDFPDEPALEPPKEKTFATELEELINMATTTRTDAFDHELPSVYQFLQQITKMRAKMDKADEGSTQRLLYQTLLNNLDQTHLSKETVKLLMQNGDITERQIRVFMANHRKRSVYSHKPGVQKDVETVRDAIVSIDAFIQGYLRDITHSGLGDVYSSPVIAPH